jgi:ribokinase
MSEKAPRADILVVGSANMDMVVTTGRFPKPGETVLGSSFGMYPGGKGANQAVAAAKLGGRVALLSRMGRDLFRDRLLESLEKDGVDTAHILVDEETPTGIALITVEDAGQNEIVVVPGSNMNLAEDDVIARRSLFQRAACVLLQLEIPIETVLRAATLGHAGGASVLLNPAPAAELPDALLEVVDVLTPNESEIELLTGRTVTDRETAIDAARALTERGVRHVILTLGRRGALHVTADEARSYAAYRVDAVDATAAGDAFNGALASRMSRGEDLAAAVPFANAVAACCVMRMGAQVSMPTAAEVEEFLRRQPAPALEDDA